MRFAHSSIFLHFLISDETDVFILAPLCQEYQVDWLTDKIKSYILNCSTSNTETILKYLSLADTMNFGHHFEEALIDQIDEPFYSVHIESEFIQLTQRLQILIARKLLWKVYVDKLDTTGVECLSSIIDHSLLSIFDDHQQKHLIKSLNRDHLDRIIERKVKEHKETVSKKAKSTHSEISLSD